MYNHYHALPKTQCCTLEIKLLLWSTPRVTILVAQLVEHHIRDVSMWVRSPLKSWVVVFFVEKVLGLVYKCYCLNVVHDTLRYVHTSVCNHGMNSTVRTYVTMVWTLWYVRNYGIVAMATVACTPLHEEFNSRCFDDWVECWLSQTQLLLIHATSLHKNFEPVRMCTLYVMM